MKMKHCLFGFAATVSMFFAVNCTAFAATPSLPSTATVNYGATTDITLKNAPKNVTWRVINSDILTVTPKNSGSPTATIKGKMAGTTHVKAKYNGKEYTTTVTVKPVLSKTVVTMQPSATATAQLELKGVPAGDSVTWKTSNAIVGVLGYASSSSKSKVNIYARRIGQVVFSATYKGCTYSCTVNVNPIFTPAANIHKEGSTINTYYGAKYVKATYYATTGNAYLQQHGCGYEVARKIYNLYGTVQKPSADGKSTKKPADLNTLDILKISGQRGTVEGDTGYGGMKQIAKDFGRYGSLQLYPNYRVSLANYEDKDGVRRWYYSYYKYMDQSAATKSTVQNILLTELKSGRMLAIGIHNKDGKNGMSTSAHNMMALGMTDNNHVIIFNPRTADQNKGITITGIAVITTDRFFNYLNDAIVIGSVQTN